ncbi:hypothetical protein [Rhodalgimonas zhirmunskyi]|uniref:Secreted protein n=1 Tax=Rhodalgimonas zhirmunskyi TaxID=2964767 RepID=A0AAJ1U919_9RHOB|nr:hypothetical protein [Rhodoalgimonas zhirmunskyi]MDQ2093513.1 hypothetical protein [Rhodoalgimonas zhirmunskyi]
MLKRVSTGALCAVMMLGVVAPVAAVADNTGRAHSGPPMGYTAQWWTGPAGCTYSRAGRGGEVVWFLTNRPGKGGCPEFIVTKPIDNAYRAPRWQKG